MRGIFHRSCQRRSCRVGRFTSAEVPSTHGVSSLTLASVSLQNQGDTPPVASTFLRHVCKRNLPELLHGQSVGDVLRLCGVSAYARSLHSASAKYEEMIPFQTDGSSLLSQNANEIGVNFVDDDDGELQRNLDVYEELKEYVEKKYADKKHKPVVEKMLEEYNPLAEMKEPSIVDFRPPDREIPPLDRVTIELDVEQQYRVTRKTKWVTKQLRSLVMKDVPALLEQWVKTMYPKRSDWMDLLKEFSEDEKEQEIWFQVFEFALLEETFEVKSQDLTRILVKYMNLERYDDVDRLMATLDEKCFPPDFVVCTLLLDMNINLKRLDRAKEMYDRIRSLDYVPDVIGCTNLINFLCESGNPEAGEMILAEMEDEKLHGTIDTYLTVLRGYGKQGKVDEAVRIFRMMKEDTFLNPHMGPDVYSEAMNAYVRGNKLSSAVLTMEDMLHMGMIPDDESISLLIAAFEQKNQFERALDVLLKLESRAVRPGVNTLTTLIVWFGKLGLLEEVETLFKCIEQKVDTPDSKAYASLYSAYARAGLIDKTKAILDRIEASKVILDASAYEQMILALECGKQREAAQNLRDRMIAEGLTPSDEVERALLGVDANSFLSGVTKSVEETQSNGTETESFLAGVHKDLEQPEPS